MSTKYALVSFTDNPDFGIPASVPSGAGVSLPGLIFDTEQDALDYISGQEDQPTERNWSGYFPVTFIENTQEGAPTYGEFEE